MVMEVEFVLLDSTQGRIRLAGRIVEIRRICGFFFHIKAKFPIWKIDKIETFSWYGGLILENFLSSLIRPCYSVYV